MNAANKKSLTKTKKRAVPSPVVFTTSIDALGAVLIVSLIINAFFLCLWIALQFTSRYDQVLVDFFIHR